MPNDLTPMTTAGVFLRFSTLGLLAAGTLTLGCQSAPPPVPTVSTDSWVSYTVKDKSFTLKFPKQPHEMQVSPGYHVAHNLNVEGTIGFVADFQPYPANKGPVDAEKECQQLASKTRDQGFIYSDVKKVSVDGRPAVQRGLALTEVPNVVIAHQMLVFSSRGQLDLQVTGVPAQGIKIGEPEAFFASLKLNTP